MRPLLDSEGKAFGALQIDTLDQRQRFTKEDLELLVSTASQAALAIQQRPAPRAGHRAEGNGARHAAGHARCSTAFCPISGRSSPGYEFFDYYQPAAQVGGDYFDYIPLPDGRVAIVVADVVGHGVAAALLMAKLSAETKFALFSEPTPAAAVTELNERLCALEHAAVRDDDHGRASTRQRNERRSSTPATWPRSSAARTARSKSQAKTSPACRWA